MGILKLTVIVAASSLFAQSAYSQNTPRPDSTSELYLPDISIVEEPPKPDYDFKAYLKANLHYPKQARKEDIHGEVSVRFQVLEDGRIGEVRIFKGIGYGCDEEAFRVIKQMPPWIPGKAQGQPVPVRCKQIIEF